MKAKLFLISSILVLIVTSSYVSFKMYKGTCNCAQFKQYQELIIHEDGTFDTRVDSVCTVLGNRNGDLFVKKF